MKTQSKHRKRKHSFRQNPGYLIWIKKVLKNREHDAFNKFMNSYGSFERIFNF